MSVAETETASPRGALSKLRRTKGLVNASTNSLVSSSGDGDDATGNAPDVVSEGGLRASFDKVKDRARRSQDGRRGSADVSSAVSSGRRLSSLVSKTKRKITRSERNAGLERNLSADSGNAALSGNRSDSSLLLDDSGHSSLLTDDEREPSG